MEELKYFIPVLILQDNISSETHLFIFRSRHSCTVKFDNNVGVKMTYQLIKSNMQMIFTKQICIIFMKCLQM